MLFRRTFSKIFRSRLVCSIQASFFSSASTFLISSLCPHTLYNEVWAGNLSLTATELPEALKRKQHKASVARENKKKYGNGISERPEIAALRIEEGHWEGDTVVGKRAGKEAVVLSLLEKKTENYIAMRIPGKDSASVLEAMRQLKEEYGDRFDQIFKTIAVDNGSVPFPVSWTVKMKKKQKETQDILSYHTQAAGCSDKARAKASGGRQPIEECGRTGL